MLAARLALISAPVRLASADDEIVAAAARTPRGTDNLALLDYAIGRFYAGPKFQFLAWVVERDTPTRVAVRLIAALLPAFAAIWFFGGLLRSTLASAFVVTAWLATWALFPGYQPILSNPLLLLGLAAVLGAGAAQCRALGKLSRVWTLLALSLYAVALLIHEVFLPFAFVAAWIVAWRHAEGERAANALGATALFLFVAGGYAALQLSLKHYAAPLSLHYDGTELAASPLVYVQALFVYTISAFPYFEVFFLRAAGETSAHFANMGELVHRIAGHVSATDVLIALFVGAAGMFAAAMLAARRPPRMSWGVVAGGLAFVFAPNLLLALTAKYQMRMHHGWPPYYYGALGMLFGWNLVIFTYWALLHRLHNRNRLAMWLAALAGGFFLAVSCGAMGAVSREAVTRLLQQPFR